MIIQYSYLPYHAPALKYVSTYHILHIKINLLNSYVYVYWLSLCCTVKHLLFVVIGLLLLEADTKHY